MPKPELHEAAVRLAAIGRFLADTKRLRWVDRQAVPDDPDWERRLNNGILMSAISVVYRAASAGGPGTRQLTASEQLGQYRHDFDLVVPAVFDRARRTFPDQILAMATRLARLAMTVDNFQTADRVRRNILVVAERGGGLETSLRRTGAAWGQGGVPGPVPADDPMAQLEVRERLAPHVAQIKDPLLSILFAHPDGLNMLSEFVRGTQAGQASVRRAIDDSGTALSDLYQQVTQRPVELWRCPRLIWAAAQAVGLGDIADLRLFLTAIGGAYLDDATGRWVTLASVAFGILATVFAPPVGIGTASATFAGLGLFTGGVDLGRTARSDYENNIAATATDFELVEERLGQHGWASTKLAATMVLLAAIAFFLEAASAARTAGQASWEGPPTKAPPGGDPVKPSRGPLDQVARGTVGSDPSLARGTGANSATTAATDEATTLTGGTATSAGPKATNSATGAAPAAGGAPAQPPPLRSDAIPTSPTNQSPVTGPSTTPSTSPATRQAPSPATSREAASEITPGTTSATPSRATGSPHEPPATTSRPTGKERLTERPTRRGTRTQEPTDPRGNRLTEPPRRDLPPYPENQYKGVGHGGSARVREVLVLETEESRIAHEARLSLMRKNAIDYNENIAVIRYKNPLTKKVEIKWVKSNGSEHAERVLESWLKETFGPHYNPGIIEKLYTERIPCGPESENCYRWMRSELYNAQIEYTFSTYTIPATRTTPARTIDANQELRNFYFRNFDKKGVRRPTSSDL